MAKEKKTYLNLEEGLQMEMAITNKEIDEMIGETKYKFEDYDELRAVFENKLPEEMKEDFYGLFNQNMGLAREAFQVAGQELFEIEEELDFNLQLEQVTMGHQDAANVMVSAVLKAMEIDSFYEHNEVFDLGTLEEISYFIAIAITKIQFGYDIIIEK